MSPATLAVMPLLVPLLAALVTALLTSHPRAQQVVNAAGVVLFLLVSGTLVALVSQHGEVRLALGGWPAPYGIEFRVDRLAAAMLLVTALTASLCLLFQAGRVDAAPANPLLAPLVQGLLAGVAGAFITADLFNLYVWVELMLIAALGLLVLGGRLRQLDGAWRYLLLNLVGTVLLLFAVSWAYAATGHLNFAAIHAALGGLPAGVALAVTGALVLAFLVKAGAFPLAQWLPASYHTLPAPLLALFAGILTKVGVYVVLRFMADVFAPAPAVLSEALGWIAAATMLVGVIGAAYHWDLRRILAFHIISQIGYILLAIAVGTATAWAAALFYTVHHILVKASLFLVAALIARETGSYDLRRIGGLWNKRPLLGVLFLVPALSLVGIPPLSGFWAKLLVLRETIAAGRVAWTVVAVVVGMLTLYSMAKVWIEAFWKPAPGDAASPPAPDPRVRYAWAATAAFATLTVAIGLGPEALLRYALAAAAALAGSGHS